MLFPLTFPLPPNCYRLSLQIWDKDLIDPNDFISEATIDFSKEAKLAYENDTTISMYSNRRETDDRITI